MARESTLSQASKILVSSASNGVEIVIAKVRKRASKGIAGSRVEVEATISRMSCEHVKADTHDRVGARRIFTVGSGASSIVGVVTLLPNLADAVLEALQFHGQMNHRIVGVRPASVHGYHLGGIGSEFAVSNARASKSEQLEGEGRIRTSEIGSGDRGNSGTERVASEDNVLARSALQACRANGEQHVGGEVQVGRTEAAVNFEIGKVLPNGFLKEG